MPDNHSNFGYSLVLTAPTPAASGTSLVLAAGGGALMPTAPWNGTVWPTATGPLLSNAEIVRVTAVVGDTLTIVRAQEGTAARAIVAGDQFANTITVKVITDIEADVALKTTPAAALAAAAGIKLDDFAAPDDNTDRDATTSLHGLMAKLDKVKLDGVAAGATANSTDAQLRDRTTHTGAQAIATVTGLQTALDAKAATSQKLDDFGAPDDNTDLDATTLVHGLMPKADKVKLDAIEAGATADQTNAEIETAYNAQVAIVSQAEAETGTATTVRRWTAQRIGQAIAALAAGGGAVSSIFGRAGAVVAVAGDYLANLITFTPAGNIAATDVQAAIEELDSEKTTAAAALSAAAGIKLDDFAAPDDNTDRNATTTAHGLLLKATAPAAGLVNVVGIANGETDYTNKALFDTTNPAALGTVGPGTAVIAARRDHIHARQTAIVNAEIDAGAAIALSKLATDPLARANHTGTQAQSTITGVKAEIGIACSDETTAITAATNKVKFRMPYAMTLTAVRASVTTAPTDATILIDINEGGVSILSTLLMIDATEKTSQTATTAAVISDAALADDAEISIDFDQVGSTVAGTGVKVWLIGTRT